MEQHRPHILVVTYPAQGHINPALHLAKHLAKTNDVLITFSTAISAHRKMFPGTATQPDELEVEDGPITYIPYTDGYDDGYQIGAHDINHFTSQLKTTGSTSLSAILQNLHRRGRHVSCVIYTFLLSWAADVARHHSIPSAHYWIQPATVFAVYYHYFHGHDSAIAAARSVIHLPGLPPMQVRDLPSFVTSTPTSSDDPYAVIFGMLRDAFETLDREAVRSSTRPKVLVNTFEELEPEAVSAVGEKLEIIPVGPVVPDDVGDNKGDLLKQQDEKEYMEWLDSKGEKAVVYVSFGSMAVLRKPQMEELLKGLKESGRPYLWVVRREQSEELGWDEEGGEGMVVEWCSQVRVLSHRSVGCFVTHCGWNSTVESLVCGVATVGVPQWTDQGTNAMLAEKAWGTGVRGEVNVDGILEGEELKRCLELVMGEGERGVEMRRRVGFWKDRAAAAIGLGGSSDRNLRAFIDQINK